MWPSSLDTLSFFGQACLMVLRLTRYTSGVCSWTAIRVQAEVLWSLQSEHRCSQRAEPGEGGRQICAFTGQHAYVWHVPDGLGRTKLHGATSSIRKGYAWCGWALRGWPTKLSPLAWRLRDRDRDLRPLQVVQPRSAGSGSLGYVEAHTVPSSSALFYQARLVTASVRWVADLYDFVSREQGCRHAHVSTS